MIRQAIENVSENSMDLGLRTVSNGLDVMAKKSKYGKDFKRFKSDFNDIMKELNISEGFMGFMKNLLKVHTVTKDSDLEEDVSYILELINTAIDQYQKNDGDYEAQKIEQLRIKFVRLQDRIEKDK